MISQASGAPARWIVVRRAPPGLEEDLLEYLLGVRAIANDANDEVEDELGVAVVQAFEPGAVPRAMRPISSVASEVAEAMSPNTTPAFELRRGRPRVWPTEATGSPDSSSERPSRPASIRIAARRAVIGVRDRFGEYQVLGCPGKGPERAPSARPPFPGPPSGRMAPHRGRPAGTIEAPGAGDFVPVLKSIVLVDHAHSVRRGGSGGT